MAYADPPSCKPGCLPFNVEYDSSATSAVLQVEYFDCTTKKKVYAYLYGENSSKYPGENKGNYCFAPKTEVAVEKWAGVGTNSWEVWNVPSAENGWNVVCNELSGARVSCRGTPEKTTNCKTLTVANQMTSSDQIMQPEYTECTSKKYLKAQLGPKDTATYYVEPNTDVRVEQSRGYPNSVNRWGPQKVGNGWTVTCTEVKGIESCTAKAN